MVACGSVSIKVTDSVVGKVPGSGNAVGGSSLGPDPCGSGGPNCAWGEGAMQRNVTSINRRNKGVPPKRKPATGIGQIHDYDVIFSLYTRCPFSQTSVWKSFGVVFAFNTVSVSRAT